MKTLNLFFCIVILGHIKAGCQQEYYNIEVSIKNGPRQGTAFLRYFTDNGPYFDSVKFKGGQFTIKGKAPKEIKIAKMYLREENGNENKENSCDVWLAPGTIKIAADKELIKAKYSGSVTQAQFSELQASLVAIRKKNFILNRAYEKAEAEKDIAAKDKLLNEEFPALFAEKQKILGAFIMKYPSSLVSAYMFEDFAGDEQMNLAVVEPCYASLSKSIKQHPRVKKVADRINICKRTAPGMNAIDFSQTDTAGNIIILSSFRGKYLLIDFWAGWCVPCRAENPHLTRLYSQYNNHGFEIISVSLDGERPSWTNAIIKDDLKWFQVSDLRVFDNAVAKLYGITSIPQNILIGPDGKIIAWNLKGTVLDEKLNKLFSQ